MGRMKRGPVTDLARRMREYEKQRDKERRGQVEYGVFEWNANNRYPRASAVKVYKQKAAAERFARPRNLVVRTVESAAELERIRRA